jgi:low affinity Fe/Cu permease
MPQPRKFHAPGSLDALRRVSATRGSLARSLEHPADRIENRRGPFDQFSQRVSFLASSPLFFLLCALLVIAWAVGLGLGASDRLEATLTGAMSGLTLLLVAVLKNSELRAERALQTKLDAIAAALLDERRGEESDAEEQLERSIGVHDQI